MSEKDVSLKIKSVKVMEATEKIKVVYKDTSNNKDDELTGIYSDKASPEFYSTMEKLNAIAAGICQFTDEYAKRLRVYGVTYHYSKDGTMGAMLHCKMELPDTEQELVFNTPMRKCAPDDITEGLYLSDTAAKALWDMETEIRKYISGKRAQISLFGDNGEAMEEEPAITEPLEKPQKISAVANPAAQIRAKVIDISKLDASTLPN